MTERVRDLILSEKGLKTVQQLAKDFSTNSDVMHYVYWALANFAINGMELHLCFSVAT